jgi:hypothetical protein
MFSLVIYIRNSFMLGVTTDATSKVVMVTHPYMVHPLQITIGSKAKHKSKSL